MLRVQICLGAVRARELAVSILDGNHGVLRGGGASLRRGRTPRSTREDAATALGANDMSRLVTVGQRLLHEAGGTVRGLDTRLRHDTARRHRAQVGGHAAAGGSRGDGLGVRGSHCCLRHHAGRRGVALRRRRVVTRHLVVRATAASMLGLGIVGHGSAVAGVARGRVRRVGRRGGARRVRVAPVHLVHGGRLRLERRQRGLRLGQRGVVLRELMRRDGGWGRWVRSRGRRVYTIGRVLRRVHATQGLLAGGCRRGKKK